MKLKYIKIRINIALERLYKKDYFLIKNGLCERTLNHRFAMYLEPLFRGRSVDCEYNVSHLEDRNTLKRVTTENGNYIDIVVRKRDRKPESDFVCFEVKKWDNLRDREQDREKLRILTSGDRFCYKYGFFLVFGKTKNDIMVEVYEHGEKINEYQGVCRSLAGKK